MHYSEDRSRWDDESIGVLREDYLARKSISEIIVSLKEKCGIVATGPAVHNALARHCAEERSARRQELQEKLDANRTRARELIASGLSVYEAASIMGVKIDNVYDWVPSEARPKSPTFEFNEWLKQFQPIPVQEDPIVDCGKLIYELELEDCRWPIGKDADGAFRFCGCGFHRSALAGKSRPYCTTHAELDRKKIDAIGKRPDSAFRVRKNTMPAVLSLMGRSVDLAEPEELKMAA